MDQTSQIKPAGKTIGITGFTISLIALLSWFFITRATSAGNNLSAATITVNKAAVQSHVSMPVAVGWLVFSLLGILLSAFGFKMLDKTGRKGGLAVTGVVLGFMAVVLSAKTCIDVSNRLPVRTEFHTTLENVQSLKK